jgi:hypothetical protein
LRGSWIRENFLHEGKIKNQKSKGKRQKAKGKNKEGGVTARFFFIFAFCLLPFDFSHKTLY